MSGHREAFRRRDWRRYGTKVKAYALSARSRPCSDEQPLGIGSEDVEISNPDRLVFPEQGITKADVAAYYQLVGTAMLPFVAGRALTVERYPKGLSEKGFMQKNAPDHYPNGLIARHEVPREGGGTTVYPVLRSVEDILFFANLGVIAFHVPPSRVDGRDNPDWIIWDLDPPEGRVDLVRESARALRDALVRFGVPAQPMTSGSKGYHLRARVGRPVDWETAVLVARGIAALAASSEPDLMTLEFRKSERGERVFVDWLRNAPYATSVAPWSLRARSGAPVATPISWEELDGLAPDEVRMPDVPDRLGSDPWAGMPPVDLVEASGKVEDELVGSGIVLDPFDRFRS